jgi:hypothetical protein
MPTYYFKGKITCYSRSDGSVVATWFKDLTIDAVTEADAVSKMELNLRQEYEDTGIRISHEMQLLRTEGTPAAAPELPTDSLNKLGIDPPRPAATPSTEDPFRFRI